MTKASTIYMDYAAATPVDERVVRAMLPYFSDNFYNPSSPYAPAVEVRRELDDAKHQIAQIIGAKSSDIIFTAGATESINLAMTAAEGGHIVTTAIEHHAVLESSKQYSCTVVGVKPNGLVDPEVIEAAITSETQLVSVALANNELGTIQSISKIAALVDRKRSKRREQSNQRPIWLHTDASQGVGQIDINVARLGVDLLTLNAGKCYGPKQVGLLWRSSRVKLTPIIHGGGQEMNLRSGTENVPGIIGFATALALADKSRKPESARLAGLRDDLESRLSKLFPEMIITGHPKKRLPGHLHISFPGIDAERVLFGLEAEGVLVATGSACAANQGTRSHVLVAVGLSPQQADGSLRISLGRFNDAAQIEQAAQLITKVVQREMARVAK